MRLVAQITGIASTVLLLCSGAIAQTRQESAPRIHSISGSSSSVRVLTSDGVAVNRTVNQAAIQGASDAQITIINDNNNNLTSMPFIAPAFETRIVPSSPGLGFDFAHMAAVGRSQTVSVPAGFVSGGFFLPSFSQPAPIVVVQPAPVVVIQQPVPQQEDAADRPSRASRALEERPVTAPPPEPAPLRDVGEFVLVRRDGGQVLAVAFTVHGGQINYVTKDGVRRSVALSVLDLDATRNENAERGTTLRLSAR